MCIKRNMFVQHSEVVVVHVHKAEGVVCAPMAEKVLCTEQSEVVVVVCAARRKRCVYSRGRYYTHMVTSGQTKQSISDRHNSAYADLNTLSRQFEMNEEYLRSAILYRVSSVAGCCNVRMNGTHSQKEALTSPSSGEAKLRPPTMLCR